MHFWHMTGNHKYLLSKTIWIRQNIAPYHLPRKRNITTDSQGRSVYLALMNFSTSLIMQPSAPRWWPDFKKSNCMKCGWSKNKCKHLVHDVDFFVLTNNPWPLQPHYHSKSWRWRWMAANIEICTKWNYFTRAIRLGHYLKKMYVIHAVTQNLLKTSWARL